MPLDALNQDVSLSFKPRPLELNHSPTVSSSPSVPNHGTSANLPLESTHDSNRFSASGRDVFTEASVVHRHSKSSKLLPPSRASLRGVSRGIVKAVRHQEHANATPCWVFLDQNNIDVLLLGLTRPDLKVERVYCRKSPPPLALALEARGSFSVHPWPLPLSTTPTPVGAGAIGLSNVRLCSRLFQFLEAHHITLAMSTVGSRKLPSEWHSSLCWMDHASLGGVTTTRCRIAAYQFRQPIGKLLPLSSAKPRDVSTVMEFSPVCHRFVPIPDPSVVMPLVAKLVGPGRCAYHGRGLLGSRPTQQTLVATPTPSARPGFWGIRPLEFRELLQVYDIGERFLPLLMQDPPSLDRFVPLHSLSAALTAVLQETGGDFVLGSPGQEVDELPREFAKLPVPVSEATMEEWRAWKGSKGLPGQIKGSPNTVEALDVDEVNSKAETVVTSNCRKPSSHHHVETVPMDEDDDSGLCGDSLLNCDRSPSHQVKVETIPMDEDDDSFPDLSGNSLVDCDSDSDDESSASPALGVHILQNPEERDLVEDEDLAPPLGDLPPQKENFHPNVAAEVDREAREKKATKNDKAPVPTYLWKEHLIDDDPSGIPWPQHSLDKLDWAMDVLRKQLFRKWKLRLMDEWWHWMKQRHKKSWRRADKWAKEKPRWVIWNNTAKRYEWNKLKDGRGHYKSWFCRRYSANKDFHAGRDALYRAVESTWWDWKAGSRPFFWRWKPESQMEMRDGMMVCFLGDPPDYTKPQPKHRDPATKAKVEEKLQKVLDRGYLDNDEIVVSLTSYFDVEKGADDIRMVYDGTKCGLNAAVWVPSFFMPTVQSHLRAVEEGTNMCDVDVGEMFLNFMVHPSVRKYLGVDLTPYQLNYDKLSSSKVVDSLGKVWVSWNRIAMGLKWSPYQAVKCMHLAEELIRGDRADPNNVFRWDRVRMNLPGPLGYNPSLPWVSKVRDNPDGTTDIAADLFTFVDDLRPTGKDKAEAWRAGRRAASVLNWLGLQDAPRKRRDSRQDPGAWAGSVIRTVGGVFTLVSDEKWEKTKRLVNELKGLLDANSKGLPRKRLEQIRGFLNYVCQTYKPLLPYLNGLHMTIDGFRGNRDKEGWKLPKKSRARVPQEDDTSCTSDTSWDDDWDNWSADEELDDDATVNGVSPLDCPASPPIPKEVAAVPRLVADVEALGELCSADSPPWRRVRAKTTASVFYGLGDASGPAFGATLQRADDCDIHYEFGQWVESA